MKKFNPVYLLLLSVILSGCGYTAGSLLPQGLQTIYIQPFRNKIELTKQLSSDEYRFRTYRPHLETDILKIVEPENADLIVSGELIDYLRQPVRYGSDNETVEEYRISIVCSVKLHDQRKDALMWQEPRIIGDSTYSLSGAYAGSESFAVSGAVSDLARRIVNRTIEGW
jgi:hypothetical protein